MDLPLRVSNKALPQPHVPRAQTIISLHPPYCEHHFNPPSHFKGSLVDPRLRASNEHILIVRVLRAGGRPDLPDASPQLY